SRPPGRLPVGVSSPLGLRLRERAVEPLVRTPSFTATGTVEGDDMAVSGASGDRLDDARQLQLDQLQRVLQGNALKDDTDTRIVALGAEVDVVHDAEAAQDGDDLLLDLAHTMRRQALAVGEEVSM